MSLLRPQPLARSKIARRLGVGFAVLLLGGLLPVAPAGAAEPQSGVRLRPTIHYEEALAHADDKIAFAPGGRVSVPFRPRANDHWKVGGAAPRALPAGRVSGRTMRILEPGTGAIGLDQPLVGPGVRPAAIAAAWRPGTMTPEIDLTAAVDPGALKREVFGFLPYWELGDSSTRLDWEKISTVAFFGVGAAADGSLQRRNSDGSTTVGWSGWTSSNMTSVINAAHGSGARVVLTVQSFAWSSSGATRQKALLGSSTARAKLASQIAAAVRDRGADGVNLDFEPLASGYADEFTALVRKIRSTLDATAKGYQLTFDTTGWIGNYPVGDATAPGGADAIMVMGYDYRTSGSSVAGSIAPLHAPTYDITDTLAAYLARVPASKLILGVPYYGRAWSTKTATLHSANISGTKYGASSTVMYGTARDLLAQYGRHYDPTEAVAWTAYQRQTCTKTYGCVTSWRQLYVDDAKALGAKYDLVNSLGLRGVGIWALGYDGTRTELYAALKDKFITDTVPPTISGSSLTSDVISPNGDGRLDTTSASLDATAFIKWGYRVERLSGSSAVAVRSGTRNDRQPTFTWDGRNADRAVVTDGTYRLTLWAADAPGNRAEKSWTVTVDTHRPAVTSTAEDRAFSPDGNGYDDRLSLAWRSSQAIHGSVRIVDAGGASRRIWRFTARTSWSTEWNGTGTSGSRLPNGKYIYRVNGSDRAGNQRIVDIGFTLDDTIRLHTWSDYSFDPRARQTSRMTVALRRSATVNATIFLGANRIRRIWIAKPLAAGTHTWTWSGKTSAGVYVKPGRYKVVVAATSRYGTTFWTRYVTVETH